MEELCLGGGCRALMPGERPPCRDDAGCVDGDGGDMSEPLDAGPDATPDALGDGPMTGDGAPDGPPDAGLDGSPPDFDPSDFDPADFDPPDFDPSDFDLSDFDPSDFGPPDFGPLLDAGLPDGAPDASAPDGGPLDSDPPDVSAPDEGPLDAGPVADGALLDPGGAGVDLTGLYAVTTTVVVTTGGALSAGDELHRIHHLTLLGGTRYRLDVFATDGAFEHRSEADFASPQGPGRYQFEYDRSIPSPEGCEGLETRFERGRFELFEPGYRLRASQERTAGFDGADCRAEGYLVHTETDWIPLPPP